MAASECTAQEISDTLGTTPAAWGDLPAWRIAVCDLGPVDMDYLLEVDWNADGDFSDTGEDLTAARDVQAIEFSEGRDFASQLIGRALGGELRATLNNDDGRYSSFNTGSPLTGNILPGRKVRLRAVDVFVGLHVAYIWSGFLRDVTPLPNVHGWHKAELYAVGPLAYIAERKVDVAMQTSILTADAADDVLDAAAWAAADRTMDAGQLTMDRWWAEKVQAIWALRQVEETEEGFLRETPDGKIAFEDRHHRLKSPHTVSQATWTDAAGGALSYSEIPQDDSLRQIANVVECEVEHYTVGSLAVLWTLAESGADSPGIDAGLSKDFWTSYPNPDSATADIAVDAWTTPVATTDYTANSAADGSGSNLTANITVAVSKFAKAMKITLTNGAAVMAYITLLQARGTPVSRDDPIRLVQEDSSSQTKYGERSYIISAPFLPTSVEGEARNRRTLSIYKDPIPILRPAFHGNRSNATLDELLTRQVSDRVTVVANGDSDLGINEDFFVESRAGRIDADRRLTMAYAVSQASQFAGFWVLGTSSLGVDTKVA